MICLCTQYYIQSFKVVDHMVYKTKKLFGGTDHILAWLPSWTCDPDKLNKLKVPLTHGFSTCYLVLIGQAVLKKMLKYNGHILTDFKNAKPRLNIDIFWLKQNSYEFKCIRI